VELQQVILAAFVVLLGAALAAVFVYALRPDKPAKPGEWYEQH
jgi:hypothetical protein